MFPVVIIIGINGCEDLGAGIGLIDEASVLEHLAFDGAHERFGPGVVVGIGSG